MSRRTVQALCARQLVAALCLAPVSAAAQQPGSYREAVQAYVALEKDIAVLQEQVLAGRIGQYDYNTGRIHDERGMGILKQRWGAKIAEDARAADPSAAEAITPGHVHFPALREVQQEREAVLADMIVNILKVITRAGLAALPLWIIRLVWRWLQNAISDEDDTSDMNRAGFPGGQNS